MKTEKCEANERRQYMPAMQKIKQICAFHRKAQENEEKAVDLSGRGCNFGYQTRTFGYQTREFGY